MPNVHRGLQQEPHREEENLMALYSKAAYIQIATVLRMLFDERDRTGDASLGGYGLASRKLVADTLASMFESDNAAFHREQFLTNAGIEPSQLRR